VKPLLDLAGMTGQTRRLVALGGLAASLAALSSILLLAISGWFLTAAAIAGADVVHLAAHGVHEPDNPLFSCVRLADGPLYAHELDGVDLSGAVVVLSACETGRASVRLGGEPLGMTSVLLRLGARAVVSAVAPLRDDVAARVMPHLHAELRAATDPAAALARAVAAESEPVPLVCFGPLSVDGRPANV